ncbi:hypothetical protein QW180_16845 [Vibrio sinaloensis]|nr:hypothetical protein [Vibrio sinaloensis]
MCGAECLIRWTLKGNFVSPVEFIPIAERIGDIGIFDSIQCCSAR